MKKTTVNIIMPTLNEIVGLKAVMPKIKGKWHSGINVIDGHSTDGTIEWCREQGYNVLVQNGRGAWEAFRELYHSNSMLMSDDSIVVTFSPDGNSLPEAIPHLVKKIRQGYDMVIASRYKGKAKSYDDTLFSRLGNWLFTVMINLLYGSKYTDALVIYRAYRGNIINELGFIKDTPWLMKQLAKLSSLTSWEIGLSIRCAKKQLKVTEIGVDEPMRIDQVTKRKSSNKIKHGTAIFSQFLYEILHFPPSRIMQLLFLTILWLFGLQVFSLMGLKWLMIYSLEIGVLLYLFYAD